jgi:hypothetical protein
MSTDEQYDHDTSAVLLRLRCYIETWFGPRCPEYEGGCAVCYMWNVYDKLSKYTQLNATFIALGTLSDMAPYDLIL